MEVLAEGDLLTKCRYGHTHPPEAVKQSQNPFSGKDGRVHCPACSHATGKLTVEHHWYTFTTAEIIQSVLHSEVLCRRYFPGTFYSRPRWVAIEGAR